MSARAPAEWVGEGLEHHRADRLVEAEKCYRAALESQGPSEARAEALHYLGIVAQQTGRSKLAEELLYQSVEAAPERGDFQYNLGNLFHEQLRYEATIGPYRRAIELSPEMQQAYLNLGSALHALGRFAEAVEVLEKLVALCPELAAAYHNVGLAYYGMRRDQDAVVAFRRAAELDRTVDAVIDRGTILLRTGSIGEAIAAYQEAIAIDPKDARPHIYLGQALAGVQRMDEAVAAYERVLEIDPKNIEAPFLIAAARGQTPASAPREYVTRIFDKFADRFDHHLVKTLQYHTPELMYEAVAGFLRGPEARLQPPLVIFDAGCGTGLCGPLFAPLSLRLIGVDLSSAMLDQARRRGSYQELIAGELTEELGRRAGAIDLVLAADVFVYVGDLAATFEAARAALRPNGLLAFSVEAHEGTGFVLCPSRRYAHSLGYLRGLATRFGFEERQASTENLRLEKGVPVEGYVVILQKPAA